MSNTGVTKVL